MQSCCAARRMKSPEDLSLLYILEKKLIYIFYNVAFTGMFLLFQNQGLKRAIKTFNQGASVNFQGGSRMTSYHLN